MPDPLTRWPEKDAPLDVWLRPLSGRCDSPRSHAYEPGFIDDDDSSVPHDRRHLPVRLRAMSKEEIAKMRELRRQCFSHEYIAREMNCSDLTVSKHVRDLKVPRSMVRHAP